MNFVEMMVNAVIQQYPQLSQAWQQALQMSNGKDEKEMKNLINNLAKTQNIDLKQAENQFNQFVGSFQNPMIGGRR